MTRLDSIPLIEATAMSVVDIGELMGTLRQAYSNKLKRETIIPDRTTVVRAQPYAVYGAIPVICESAGLFIVKAATLTTQRMTETMGPRRRPTINSIVTVFSTWSGQAIALLDGAMVTNVKCAAVSALVTEHCRRNGAVNVAFIGTGVVARQQLIGVLAVRPINSITIFGRDPGRMDEFARFARGQIHSPISIKIVSDVRECIAERDVICTATTTSEPLVSFDNLPSDVHINCMGSHTQHSREISRDVLENSVLIVEDRKTAIAEAGLIHEKAIELEELISGDHWRDTRARTIFSSTGHGFLDLVTVRYILSKLGILTN
jgi:ornithine cyclodeaminase/alanine dehydrogenase-like protein (mu-crystallin family)